MPVQALSVPKKYLSLILILVMSTVLLAACGDSKSGPTADTTGLEVVTAGAVTTAANAAVTTSAPTIISNTADATTAAATTAASASTTAAATTAATTTNAATTAATTTNAATTAASTTAATTAAKTTTAAATTAAATTKATSAEIKKGVLLEPMSWQAQTWNNCAPMSAVMALSYYGVSLTEAQCAKVLRPNSNDKHVRPEELVAFIRSKGFKTMQLENGSLDTLRALLSAGVPVITQQWLYEGDDIGHYRVARGYDLAKNIFIYNDSMDRHDKTQVSADLQDKLWKGYDRRYFPVYTAATEAKVLAIVGSSANPATNLDQALTSAKKYADTNPKDIDGWRNLGYLQYATGDYKAALATWEQHLTKMLASSENGPYNRFLWYQLWPMESYNKVGNYQQVIKMAPNEIEKTKAYAEARYEYAFALMNTGHKDDAIAQLKKGLLDDPNYTPINDMLTKLGVA